MARVLHPGYILHADPQWVDFHLMHSIGRTFGCTRRVGTPMRNVSQGGVGFFLRREERVKHVAFWGYFLEDVKTTPAAAWNQFGTSLGAPSFEVWMKRLGKLRDIDYENSVAAVVAKLLLRDAKRPKSPRSASTRPSGAALSPRLEGVL